MYEKIENDKKTQNAKHRKQRKSGDGFAMVWGVISGWFEGIREAKPWIIFNTNTSERNQAVYPNTKRTCANANAQMPGAREER